jgi:pimeloyl-ACP methyl ester carboxylesterase
MVANAAGYRKSSLRAYGQLLDFRSTHPVHRLKVNGHQWNYYTGGTGKTWIVLLHSVGVTAEALFQQIHILEKSYLVLGITYPASIEHISDTIDGIRAVLDHEGIVKAHFYGMSLGGMLTQCFARIHPERVDKLILSHTTFPVPARTRESENMLRALRWIPYWMIKRLVRYLLLYRADHQPTKMMPEDRAFLADYLVENFATLVNKQALINWTKLEREFDANYHFARGDLSPQPKILIVESDHDEVYDQDNRKALHGLYPDATIHLLHGTGHVGIQMLDVNIIVEWLKG